MAAAVQFSKTRTIYSDDDETVKVGSDSVHSATFPEVGVRVQASVVFANAHHDRKPSFRIGYLVAKLSQLFHVSLQQKHQDVYCVTHYRA